MVVKTLIANAEKAKNMVKLVIENFEQKIKKNDPANNFLNTAIITIPKFMTKKTKNKLKNIAGRVLFKKRELVEKNIEHYGLTKKIK